MNKDKDLDEQDYCDSCGAPVEEGVAICDSCEDDLEEDYRDDYYD